MFPRLAEGTANGGQDQEDGGNKDGATTAQVVVERIGAPAANKGAGNVRSGVDQTDQPVVAVVVRGVWGFFTGADAELSGKAEIGTVGTGLVPSLDGGTDRADDDGDIQGHGMSPLVGDFDAQGLFLIVREIEVFVVAGVLSDESAFLQHGNDVSQVVFLSERLDVGEQDITRDIGQRVGDPEVVKTV